MEIFDVIYKRMDPFRVVMKELAVLQMEEAKSSAETDLIDPGRTVRVWLRTASRRSLACLLISFE